MNKMIESMLAAGPLVTDGAWGTELQRRGLGIGECPDAWNLSHPDKVHEVAAAYVAAGSDVILTNTFGANRLMLGRHGLADQLAQINTSGVQISREAAGARARVFASMGPTGVMLLMGDVSREEVEAAFAEQAETIAAAGADAVVIESMSDPDEARLAIRAVRAAGLPVVACLVFDSGAQRDQTMMGTTPEQAAEWLTAEGADCVGANCGNGIDRFVPICRRLHAATNVPIWIKANAGLPKMVDGQACYSQKPDEFAAHVPALLEAGASFIGGCCGTTPEFIAAIKQKMAETRA
ncbi:MAG: homocysteine S-methyltransferase family protein [Pirellulales bacterium]|nr:homocysteine S-methyltransferase family protein [Pirellulales bacterium]